MNRVFILSVWIALWLISSEMTTHAQSLKIKPGSGKKDSGKKNTSDKPAAQEETSGNTFKVGDVAEGLETDGKWYKVDILKVESGKYFIHWQGYQSQYDRWIESGKVRAVNSASTTTPSTMTSAASGASAASGTKFKVGDKIEAIDFGRWNKGTVQNIRTTRAGNPMYTVAYDDGGSKEFAEDKLRVIAVYNFSGMNFKIGEYVRVWYSGNDSMDTPILDIKDNKMLIHWGGRGDTWMAFDAKELRNNAHAAAVVASRQAQENFFNDVDAYQEAIICFGYLYNEKYNTNFVMYNSGLHPPKPSDVNQLLAQMDALDALIKSKYPGIENTEPTWTTELSKNPGHWRTIAEHRKELAQSIVTGNLKRRLDDLARGVTGYDYLKNHEISEFNAGSGISAVTDLQDMIDNNGVNFVKEQLAKAADVIKTAQDAGLGASEISAFENSLKQRAAEVKSQFAASLPSSQFNPTEHDAAAETAGRNYIQKYYTGATVLKIGTIGNDYTVVKNDIGIPKYRYKRLGILIRDNKNRMRFLPTYYRQDYAGNGSYSSAFIEHHFTYYQK